jgi:subtilisin-like proprotein convertase family protein
MKRVMNMMACASLLACAGVAMAQPTVTENLGTLTGNVQRDAAISAATITWYKFTISDLPASGVGYLDIGTRAGSLSNGDDSEIGLYDAAGNMKANDDDGGAGFWSALSFGNTSSPRPADGTGLAFNGRNGALTAGTYYLAVGAYNTTFGTTAWNVTSSSTATGTAQTFINYLSNSLPYAPTGAMSASPTTARNDQTTAVTLTCVVTPGGNPASTAHRVTVDTSSLGDIGGQPKTMALGSGNTFTYSFNIPTGLPSGPYVLTATVQETAPQTRSSTCTTTVTVVNPPTGQCCTGDGCLLLTQADCAAQGGTYGGDNTACGGCSCVTGITNDHMAEAIELSNGSVEQGTTCGATIDTGEAILCNGQTISAPGVWYSCVGTGNTMQATLCGGPVYDSRMSVFCVSNGLTCVGGNDDFCSVLSQVNFCTQEGATYYILVHGFGGATGSFQISLTDDSVPCSGGVSCIPTGACCLPSGCEILTADQCTGRGGSYSGDGTNCGTLNYNAAYTANDTPVAIPDLSTATSTLAVADSGMTVNGLAVAIDLNHTFAGDLIITVSNGSNSVILSSRLGGGSDLIGRYVFTDLATVDLAGAATGTVVTPGNILPSNPLNAFDGQPMDGTWTLTISDNAGLDVGTINAWSIGSITTHGPCDSACPGCAADFNQDGGVDGSDIESFFGAWAAGDACGDTNQDGGVDGADIESFFRVWAAGGC